MYYDDFYNEPSEFEMQIEEFKDGLRQAVKQEYLSKIERLENELAEFKSLKENWDDKVSELNKAKKDAEFAKSEAEQNAKSLRLWQLLSDCFETAYGVTCVYDYAFDKCDKCDEDGYIHYFSPQGRECKELCNCRKQVNSYIITEAKLCKIRNCNTKVYLYFKYRSTRTAWNEVEDEYETVTDFVDNTPFEEINYYNRLFHSKEKAQEYCDWMNKKARDEFRN